MITSMSRVLSTELLVRKTIGMSGSCSGLTGMQATRVAKMEVRRTVGCIVVLEVGCRSLVVWELPYAELKMDGGVKVERKNEGSQAAQLNLGGAVSYLASTVFGRCDGPVLLLPCHIQPQTSQTSKRNPHQYIL